ncbi:SLAIN motif-containing protein-like isoform X2 [Syngnathus acus]|uniref:SLAIN motif-containing protein-like isoform X2 n=1 Tax=Syngnathus acus TaxID=161584 RepID=UPI0018864DB2|nr:SLAIN motif-containing protein-like isoform X2 [Syngnathus acus]
MEAAVNLVNVDLKKNLANGELHLRRVHKLVLSLGLLNKQKLPTGPRGRACTPLPCQLGSPRAPKDRIQYLQKHYEPLVLDEVELLDLDATGFSDHETWLYVPPQTKKNSQDPVTPLQWCRHVLEAPEWKVARRFMHLQLESALCWRQVLSSPGPTTTPPPLGKVAVMSPISSPRSPETHAHSQSPSGRARTPTFIPHLTRGSNSSPRRRSSPRLQADLAVVIPPGPDEEDLVPHGYKLKDLTDVQVVARLQEENLRAHRYFSFINPSRTQASLRQHFIRPGHPTQPECHPPAQRSPRPGRRSWRQRSPLPTARPHLLQRPKLAKQRQLPVRTSLRPTSPLRRPIAAAFQNRSR